MPQLIANIGSRQALIDDVLVGSKVRYLSNFSVAPHFGERPESVHPGRSSAAGRPTVHHESRSVRPQLGDLDMVIGRFRFVVIAVAVAIIAGFAVLGAQIWLMNARIDQLATKVSGIDATFGVEVGRNQRKARRREHEARCDLPTAAGRVQNNRSRNRGTDQRDRQKHRFPARPSAVTSHLSPTRTGDRTKARAAAEGSAVTRVPPRADERRSRRAAILCCPTAIERQDLPPCWVITGRYIAPSRIAPQQTQ